MTVEYILFGGGDFAVEIASYIRDCTAASAPGSGIITDIVSPSPPRTDDFERIIGGRPAVHAALDNVTGLAEKFCVIGIGDPGIRKRAMDEVIAAGGRLAAIIHPRAYVAETATIGDGSIICPFAFVGPFAVIGSNCALNVGAIVGHDARLSDCTVLSPGADINGHGSTGTAAFLGAGAIINPKVHLGRYSKLSAASVLNKTVGDGFLMHGNPASGRQMIRVPEQG